MEKIIYENQSGRLVADVSDGVVNIAQYFYGVNVGTVSMYFEEVIELMEFLNTINIEN